MHAFEMLQASSSAPSSLVRACMCGCMSHRSATHLHLGRPLKTPHIHALSGRWCPYVERISTLYFMPAKKRTRWQRHAPYSTLVSTSFCLGACNPTVFLERLFGLHESIAQKTWNFLDLDTIAFLFVFSNYYLIRLISRLKRLFFYLYLMFYKYVTK